MSKTTQSTGGFPTEFRPASEEGGGEGRARSLVGQWVEVIWDSVPGGKNSEDSIWSENVNEFHIKFLCMCFITNLIINMLLN